jgi:hypothetical protein
MRHAGAGTTRVVAGDGPGQFELTDVGFVHAGSWELNVTIEAGDRTDTAQLLLCVQGTLPFASCYNPDPTDDEGCEDAIDVRCRGDEVAVGESVRSDSGFFDVELTEMTPSPPDDQTPTTIVLTVDRFGGDAAGDATIGPGQCTGMGPHP